MDRLAIKEDRYCYRIGWHLSEEGDFGLMLGQVPQFLVAPEPKSREQWECWTAERAAAEQKPEKDKAGYYWESKTAAQGALRVIKAALKAERPLPEWAKTALAAGWKAPKAWKP